MTDPSADPRWLVWAREVQAIAQTGLAFTEEGYDHQRYRRLMEIAAEITASESVLPQEEILRLFLAHPGYATPKIDVRGAVIASGRILLVQEKSDSCWSMPGGWADVGDIPSVMIAREVREESGLEVVARKVVGIFDANRSGRPLEFFHAFKIIFLCERISGEPVGGDETSAAEFFAPDALPPLSSNRTNERHIREVFAHVADPLRPTAFD
jgi:ADP-ribose pyrophosphatase YjhB (NUDIX family)